MRNVILGHWITVKIISQRGFGSVRDMYCTVNNKKWSFQNSKIGCTNITQRLKSLRAVQNIFIMQEFKILLAETLHNMGEIFWRFEKTLFFTVFTKQIRTLPKICFYQNIPNCTQSYIILSKWGTHEVRGPHLD